MECCLMLTDNITTLYQLLPTVYRQRDLEQNLPLQALLSLLEQELKRVEQDISNTYNNAFIETCEPWVVPYIADLLGIPGLDDAQRIIFSQKARVANTIRYRRRKGQGAVIERIIRDVTGWYAKVVEYFRYIGITQHMQFIRQGQGTTAHIRDLNAMESLNGPFDRNAHTADFRDPEMQGGKYNIPNIGLFIWRLQSFPIRNATAFEIDENNFTFHPLGQDMQLFNRPQVLLDLAQTADEVHLPVKLRHGALSEDLKNYNEIYGEFVNAQPDNSDYYGPEKSFYLIKVNVDNTQTPIKPGELVALDLSQSRQPPAGKVGVDVKLGRIVFPENEEPKNLIVHYHYGFSSEIGGGPYNRKETLTQPVENVQYSTVAKNGEAGHTTILGAINEANGVNGSGVVQILDSEIYEDEEVIDTIDLTRSLIIEAADGQRPVLSIQDTTTIQTSAEEISLDINGLIIEGQFEFQGKLQANFLHTTLIPRADKASIVYDNTNPDDNVINVNIDRCIIGAIYLPANSDLTIHDSVIDGLGEAAIAADKDSLESGARCTIERSTILGTTKVREMFLASETIFTEKVHVDRQQIGCFRYCNVPQGSVTSERFRCQPDLEFPVLAKQRANELGVNSLDVLPKSEQAIEEGLIYEALKPRFTSTQYGDPEYAQLAENCHIAISTGAEDSSEMGVFQHLKQPQRLSNINDILAEYLPFGLKVSVNI